MMSRLLIVSTLLLVLVAPASAQTPEPEAARVYGQPDFSTNAAGHGADGLSFPIGLALDGSSGLYVADRNNSRILYYSGGTDDDAFRVYGQLSDLSSYTQNYDGAGGSGLPSADSLNFPVAIALEADEGLYVTDRENHRVLYFTDDGDAEADRVYGHGGSFTSGAPNDDGAGTEGSPSADSLFQPPSVALDQQGGLYVADRDNNRVLYFADDGDTTADWVFGQFGSFTSNEANNDGSGAAGEPSAQNLNRPQFVLFGADGSLYISDTGNNRVLVLPPDALP